MLVSIVIDNFNYARFLRQAIDSALSQIISAVEVVVVDDGSTDNSRDIIASYGDRIVPVFQANGGQASAVNAGFAHCHGEIIIFLDADDVLLPMAAARVVQAFAARPGLAKVQFRMRVIDAQDRETDMIRPAPRLALASGDLRRQTVSFPFDLPWAAMSANAFSAAVLRQIMPVPVERYDQAGADWYLAHTASLFGDVSALDAVCSLYRIHGANRYATMGAGLDLDNIRHSVRYAAATSLSLQEFADRLRLPRPNPILSVSDVAGRLTLRKLDADRRTTGGETVATLVFLGLRAAVRRFDVSWTEKLLFMSWFLAMGLAPARGAQALAEAFFVPERRRPLNDWLGRQHRGAPA